MKRIKRLLIAGMLAAMLLAQMAVPVMATPPDYRDLQIENQALLNEIERLSQLISDLQNQLGGQPGAQPTPVPPQAPNVRLVSPSNIVVMPGDVLEVNLIIRNIGAGTAHSVLTQASVGDGPFTIEFINNTNTFSAINQGAQRQIIMRLTVDENATPGTYSLDLDHHFRSVTGANSSSSDTISVRVGGEVGVSNVRLSNIRTSASTVGPDQTFVVTADLQNTGSLPAHNVQVSVGNLSASTIFLTSDLSQSFFSTLEAGQTTHVSFTFQTARNIPSNVYQLDFRLTYEDSGERAAIPFFVTVLSDYAHESPNIEIRGLTAPTGRLNVGQTGIISFELINTGDAIANNVLVTASVPGADSAALVPTAHSNRQSIQNLGVGESHGFQFGFMPTTSSQTQSYAVQLRVEYTIRGADDSSSFVQYVALNVNNPEAEATPTPAPGAQIPRMIVMAYTPYPQIPRAGQNFDMEIAFLNTSPTRSVNNVRVTLNSAEATGTNATLGAVFTPVGGSNTVFIPYLSPGEYVTKNITMFTIPDAPPRVYTLDVVFDFQDSDYVEHSMTERLSIPVAQLARLETYPPEVFVPETMDMWSFINFEFSIINTGRVNLRNSWVRVEGPFYTRESNMFLSTIAAGRTITYTGRARPLETGLLEGAIVIYGEDDAGDITEIRHEFTVYVMEDMGGDFGFEGGFEGGHFPGEDGMFEGGAFERPGFDEWPYGDGDDEGIFARIFAFIRRPLFWGPAAGVVVAAIIAAVVLMKRKSSKLSFDDDDAFN